MNGNNFQLRVTFNDIPLQILFNRHQNSFPNSQTILTRIEQLTICFPSVMIILVTFYHVTNSGRPCLSPRRIDALSESSRVPCTLASNLGGVTADPTLLSTGSIRITLWIPFL